MAIDAALRRLVRNRAGRHPLAIGMFDDFDQLTGPGQVRRLRRIAHTLLPRYDIAVATLGLLAHHRQTTFRVDFENAGERFLLRFHRERYRRADEVRSEFEWLRSLRSQTSVVVPEPVATLDQHDVLRVTGAGLPDDLHCSILRWVDGRRYFRKSGPGVRVLGEVGRLMAAMHNHAEKFVPSSSFSCPVWDWDRNFGKTRPKLTNAGGHRLTAPERGLFVRAEQNVGKAMENLGTGPDVFGVIHGDLIQSNYLIHRKRVHLIDFADFGIGHFLYDMAITLFGLQGLDPDGQQRRAFISGYRQTRELSLEHEQLLNVFIAGRAVVQARFVMASAHPGDREIAGKYVGRVIEGLRKWLS